MAAFDQSLTPVSVTPAVTTNATLFTAANNSSVLVDAANIGVTDGVLVRIGITPSGGAVHWKKFDETVNAGQSFGSLGPYFLQTGDAVTVRTNDADEITFSLTGVESSP